MKISAISNNQLKTVNSNKKQNDNVSFNGTRNPLGKNITTIISPKGCILSLLAVILATPFITEFIAKKSKKETINEIENFRKSENFNKDSLKTKDYTKDSVLDFELVDKDNNKVSHDFYTQHMKAVVDGTFKGDKIVAYGITHYKYNDCASAALVDIGNGIKVHHKCNEAFKEMQAAAAKEGLNIYIVSGFRSEKYQITVFKRKFADKNFPTEEEFKSRLAFSAPSGYSEHHTGLAIDINSTSQSFANTREYEWLQEHANEYGFELSFPENGEQGLGYEPWHYRYIGDDESKEIFKAARN